MNLDNARKKKKVPKSKLQNYGSPIQLVSVSPDGKLTWNPDALKYLGSYQKIATITIVGKSRQGKSTLISKLLGLPPSHGFQTGSTNRPITLGIWFWSKPMLVNDIAVWYLDSEGCASLQASEAHDKRIQMLVWNLSSMILYNSFGLIDETTISDISLICLASNMLADAVQGEEKNALVKDTPNFVWIIRDGGAIQLEDPETKEPIDAPEYLEQALRPKTLNVSKKRKSTSTQDNETENTSSSSLLSTQEGSDGNRTREAIRKTFCKNRWCIVLNRPTNDEKLSSISNLSDAQLSPIFLEQLKKLKNYIVTHLTSSIKTYRGQPLPGWGWCQLGEKSVNALNQGCIPSIENHTATFLRMGLERAIVEVQQKWKEVSQSWMLILAQDKNRCTMDSLLETLLIQLKKQTFKQYQTHLFGGETDETKQTWKRLLIDMKAEMETFQKANLDAVRVLVRSKLQFMLSSMESHISQSVGILYWDELKKQEESGYEDICQILSKNAISFFKNVVSLSPTLLSQTENNQCAKTWKIWTEEREYLRQEWIKMISTSFQRKIVSMEKQIQLLNEQEQQFQQEYKAKDACLKEKDLIIQSMEKQKDEMEMTQCTQNTQKDILSVSLRTANEKIASYESVIDKLHQELEAENLHHQRYEILQAEFDETRLTLTKKEEELICLKTEEEEETKRLKEELSKLEAESIHNKQMAISMYDQYKQKDLENKKVQDTLETKILETSDLCKKLVKMDEALENKSKAFSESQLMLGEQLRAVKDLNNDKLKLQAKNYEMVSELENKARLEKENTNLQLTIKNKDNDIRVITNDRNALLQENKGLRFQQANLQQQMESNKIRCDKEVKELREKVGLLENKQISSKLMATKRSVSTTSNGSGTLSNTTNVNPFKTETDSDSLALEMEQFFSSKTPSIKVESQ